MWEVYVYFVFLFVIVKNNIKYTNLRNESKPDVAIINKR